MGVLNKKLIKYKNLVNIQLNTRKLFKNQGYQSKYFIYDSTVIYQMYVYKCMKRK